MKIQENNVQQRTQNVQFATETFPITLELSNSLIPMLEQSSEGETLLDKILLIEKNFFDTLGIQIPNMNIIGSNIDTNTYNIMVNGMTIGTGELKIDKVLAIQTPFVISSIEGEATKEPIFGDDALWISPNAQDEAKMKGYAVVDCISILSTHINETLRANLHELIRRQDIQMMLDQLAKHHNVLLDEIEKRDIHLSLIQKTIQSLIRDNVSIRNIAAVIEAIIDSPNKENVDDVASYVRESLSRQICEVNKSYDGKLYVITLADLENNFDTFEKQDGYHLAINVDQERQIISSLTKISESAHATGGIVPVLLITRKNIRAGFSKLVHRSNLFISVMSVNELTPEITVEYLAKMELN